MSCLFFRAESLPERELPLQSQRTAQAASPRGPAEGEGVAPGPSSRGNKLPVQPGAGFPCAQVGMPTCDLRRHLRKAYRLAHLIHKMEGHCVTCPGGAGPWGGSQGSVADCNRFRKCSELPVGRRPRPRPKPHGTGHACSSRAGAACPVAPSQTALLGRVPPGPVDPHRFPDTAPSSS